LTILTNAALASTDNELSEDGVTAPKLVGAILIQILILCFQKMTCAFVGEYYTLGMNVPQTAV